MCYLSSAACRWLKVQSHLKNYHENLQLALEVSSFYQQADNTLFAINNMVQFPGGLIISFLLRSGIHISLSCTKTYLLFQRKSISASKELDSFGDREIRDIASQIMVGNIFSLEAALLDQSLKVCCRSLLYLTYRPVCGRC